MLINIPINLDTYQRMISSISFFNQFELLDTLTSEFLAELFFFIFFALFELDPVYIRILFVWMAIIIFLSLFNKSGFFLFLLALTPPGELLLFNITSFFISSCFVFKLGIELNSEKPRILICFILGILALLFHWSAVIFIFFELLFILVFVRRQVVKNISFYFIFIALSLASILMLSDVMSTKLNAYSSPNIGYNKFHILMVFVYPVSLLFLNYALKLNSINIYRYSFLIIFIVLLYSLGYMKVGSRLLFFIDFALLIIIYEKLSLYFRGKKEFII